MHIHTHKHTHIFLILRTSHRNGYISDENYIHILLINFNVLSLVIIPKLPFTNHSDLLLIYSFFINILV